MAQINDASHKQPLSHAPRRNIFGGPPARKIAFALTFAASATAAFGITATLIGWPLSWPVMILSGSLAFVGYMGFRMLLRKSAAC